MKSLLRISTILIVFTFIFASENNLIIAGENTDVNNTDSNIQAIDQEVLPIDVEKINESRIQKSIREKIRSVCFEKAARSSERAARPPR